MQMEFSNVIKWDMVADDELAWKYPTNDILYGSQLIVGEGQAAVFVKGGEILEVFSTGTHTLITENIPILGSLIKLPFNAETPFSAEIWFINKLEKLDIKWGTRSPIQLTDKTLNLPVSVRAFGQWGLKIQRPSRLVRKLIGTYSNLSSIKISDYFYGDIIQCFTTVISRKVLREGLPVLEFSSVLNEISAEINSIFKEKLVEVGITLRNFNVESVTIPETEVKEIRSIYLKKLEANELSATRLTKSYSRIKAFDVMQAAASNTSQNAAGMLLGANIGTQSGGIINSALGEGFILDPSMQDKDPNFKKIETVKELYDEGLLDEQTYNEIVKKLIEDLI